LSIASALLIFLWVENELNYNKFHKNYSNIYRVLIENRSPEGQYSHPWTQAPLSKTLRENYAEVETAAKFMWTDFMVSYKDNIYNEFKMSFVDPEYFKIFSFPITAGDPDNPLPNSKSIILSDKMVTKYFGSEDPIGKVIALDKKNDFVVTGVFHLPTNSDIDFDFYLAFNAIDTFGLSSAKMEQNWKALNYHTYVLLKPGVSSKTFEEKIEGLIKKHNPKQELYLGLQEFSKIHLYNPDGSHAGMKYIIGFSLIGFFLILIASINFTNLSLAKARKRAKEIGLRKAVGATKKQLTAQFLIESSMIVLTAVVVSLFLANLFLPVINSGLGREISITILDIKFLLFIIGIGIFTSVISSIYPAIVLASFKPAAIVHGITIVDGRKTIFKQMLVVFQFVISIGLIVCTITVNNQLQFMRNKDAGYSKSSHFSILMQGDSKYKYELIKNDLLKNPDILNVTACSRPPINIPFRATAQWEGMEHGRIMHFAYIHTDYDFLDTFSMKLKTGKEISKETLSENDLFILNDTAVIKMGLEAPIGKTLTFWGKTGRIAGVVEDFHFQSLEYPIRPLLISFNKAPKKHYLVVRTKEKSDQSAAISYTRDVWNRINAGFSFDYSYLDDEYKNHYSNSELLSAILSGFAFLAIVISCLGVLGLTGSMIQSKMKEIGIRKVFGATTFRIIFFLFKDLSKLIIAAFIVTVPISYYMSSGWLSEFAYRIEMEPIFFIIAFLFVYAAAVMITLYYVIRAAISNPIKVLRYE
jgi:ABC-type antimicrobial peptide transport system permease subunit